MAEKAAVSIENAMLDSLSKDRTQQLANLNRIGKYLASPMQLPERLDQILAELVQALSAEAALLLLRDENSKELSCLAAQGQPGTQIVKARVRAGIPSVAERVARTAQPVLTNDLQSDYPGSSDLVTVSVLHARRLLCAPLTEQSQVIGVLQIVNRQDGSPFVGEDLDVLVSVAAQTSLVLELAELRKCATRALSEREHEASILQEIERRLNDTLDLDHVLDLTLELAMEVTGADAGSLRLLAEAAENLSVRTVIARGHSAPAHQALLTQLRPEDLPPGGETESSDAVDLTLQVRRGRASTLSVPVLSGESTIGMIGLECDQPARFSESDYAFVQRLASYAGMAMENARRYGEARQASDSRSEFVSAVSHELKAPITAIKGYADLLELTLADVLSEEQRRVLHIIVSNVEQMQKLIRDLLQLARTESGQLDLKPYPTSLLTVLDKVVASFQQQAQENELCVSVDIPARLPLLSVDPVRLNQILTNLIGNAVKYTRPGGTVAIAAQACLSPANEREHPGMVRCTVRDSGIGISREDQEKLFRRFFRADHPRVREQPGTGLGLSITRMLVEGHKGEIWAESELGKGSTFSFTLPTVDKGPT